MVLTFWWSGELSGVLCLKIPVHTIKAGHRQKLPIGQKEVAIILLVFFWFIYVYECVVCVCMCNRHAAAAPGGQRMAAGNAKRELQVVVSWCGCQEPDSSLQLHQYSIVGIFTLICEFCTHEVNVFSCLACVCPLWSWSYRQSSGAPRWCWELNLGLLEDQYTVLTAEPPLQHPCGQFCIPGHTPGLQRHI